MYNFVGVPVKVRGDTRWANTADAAKLIMKKQKYVDRIQALRSLEKSLVGFEGTEEVLNTIQEEYVKVSKKIISANRKMEREGWFTISNDQYQTMISKGQ